MKTVIIAGHSQVAPRFIREPMATNESKTAQMRVKKPASGTHHTAYGPSGTVFFETPSKARQLIDSGAFELMNRGAAEMPPQSGPLRHHAGWPLDRFSEMQALWRDDVVVCVAGGPSLTAEQVNMANAAGCRMIAINDAYRLAPFADICYFADSRWWDWHKERQEFKDFVGQKCTIFTTGMLVEDPEIHFLRNGGREGLCTDPSQIATGQNSGYQALNIAFHSGAKTIIMLGYDAHDPVDGKRNHWFGEHPVQEPGSIYALYRKSMMEIAPLLKNQGRRVINCSPGSAITAFEQMDLQDAIKST